MSGSRRAIFRAALLVVGVVLVSRVWFILHRAIDIDEFEHAHATWCVSRGLVPYADFYEHHTPWLYFLFAPLFPRFNTDTDPAAAQALLIACRFVMWAITVACVALVYHLGAFCRDRFTGMLAAALLVTTSQFINVALEFRPDVPALLLFLVSLTAAVRACRAGPRASLARFAASGLALGGALMFTQKYLFALPGFGVALLVYIVGDGEIASTRARGARVAVFALGLLTPIALTAWWFAAHQALSAFAYSNVTVNARLNADRFPPLPRLLSNVIHDPALYLFGVGGLVAAVLRARANRDAVLVATTASLLIGLFAIGRSNDQYYMMFLPLLAVFAAAFAHDTLTAVGRRLPLHRMSPVALAIVPAASLVVLLAFTGGRATRQGAIMIAGFAGATLLVAYALWTWRSGRPAAAATLALCSLLAFSAGNLARWFAPNAPQFAELAYVTAHTRPTDTVFGDSPGPGVFRPHAWFYFFLTGPFASDRDGARLVEDLESGRMRPTIVVLGAFAHWLPSRVPAYVHEHYRLVGVNVFERRSE